MMPGAVPAMPPVPPTAPVPPTVHAPPTLQTGQTTQTLQTRDALGGLIDRDRTLSTLALILDDDRRVELIGVPTAVKRLRYKPGSSAVASFTTLRPFANLSSGHESTTADGVGWHGWIACYADDRKVDKCLYRAARAGFIARRVEGAPGVVVGEAFADRTLAHTMARVRARTPGLFAGMTVLRHNPQRRLVLKSEANGKAVLVKIAAHPLPPNVSAARTRALAGLRAAGVPVVEPISLRRLPGVEVLDWWGEGDLSVFPTLASARSAGQQLAALHSTEGGAVAEPAAAALHAADASRSAALGAVRAIRDIRPEREADACRLLGQLFDNPRAGPGRLVLVHGDFSADQVLVGVGAGADVPPDDVRLVDFDRARFDLPESDLGSFVASARLAGTPEVASAMIDGYIHSGGTVDEGALRELTAIALLVRAIEPFRTLRADWAEQLDRAIELADSVLQR